MIGSLDDSVLDVLTSKLTDSSAKSLVSAALPKVNEILSRERNRLADALIGAIPWAAASAIAATFTYYTAPNVYYKLAGYASAAALAGTGGILALVDMRESRGPESTPVQAKSSSVDPYVEQATQKLVEQADPKVREIIQQERERLAGALQTGLPWASGGALALIATAFLIPDDHDSLKILGWLVVIGLLSYGAWTALDVMKQKAVQG